MLQINKEEIYNKIIDLLIEGMYDGYTGIHDEYEIDDTHALEVDIDVSFDCDGYREDDYFNGTGYCVVTSASAYVDNLKLLLYNTETGDDEPLFDYSDLEDKIEDAIVRELKD